MPEEGRREWQNPDYRQKPLGERERPLKTKAERRRENDERLSDAVAVLQQLAGSNLTPPDARKVIGNSIATLKEVKQDATVRAANAVSMLEQLSENPNIPSYTRVGLWTALSKLETIRE
ncbi:MAG: UPF0147 family protein [Nitrososphaerota archaeon]|nr:UPF0147 family protein [Nitrososphaerota archaeon]